MKLNSTTITIIISAVIILAVIAVIIFSDRPNTQTAYGELTPFAQCLANSGVKFYGAFWCPHCRDQKALFGDAAKDIPYIECSTPDMKGQLAVCSAANVTAYPTWEFPDGSKVPAVLTLEELSVRSKCPLPGVDTPITASSTTGTSSPAMTIPVNQ